MNAAQWLRQHANELAEFDAPNTDVLFCDLAIQTEFGVIEYVDTLEDEISAAVDAVQGFDLSLWEEDEDEDGNIEEEPPVDTGWNFL